MVGHLPVCRKDGTNETSKWQITIAAAVVSVGVPKTTGNSDLADRATDLPSGESRNAGDLEEVVVVPRDGSDGGIRASRDASSSSLLLKDLTWSLASADDHPADSEPLCPIAPDLALFTPPATESDSRGVFALLGDEGSVHLQSTLQTAKNLFENLPVHEWLTPTPGSEEAPAGLWAREYTCEPEDILRDLPEDDRMKDYDRVLVALVHRNEAQEYLLFDRLLESNEGRAAFALIFRPEKSANLTLLSAGVPDVAVNAFSDELGSPIAPGFPQPVSFPLFSKKTLRSCRRATSLSRRRDPLRQILDIAEPSRVQKAGTLGCWRRLQLREADGLGRSKWGTCLQLGSCATGAAILLGMRFGFLDYAGLSEAPIAGDPSYSPSVMLAGPI